MTVRELLARMDSRELAEWQAYYRLEPFGQERADLRAGIVASTLANIHRDPKRKAFAPEDFMPRFEGPEADRGPRSRPQPWQEIKADLLALFPAALKPAAGWP